MLKSISFSLPRPAAWRWTLARLRRALRVKQNLLALGYRTSATSCAVLAGLLTLSFTPPADAAVSQNWNFTITLLTINGFHVALPSPSQTIVVSGAFPRIAISVPDVPGLCPGGGTLTLSDTVSGVRVSFALTGDQCFRAITNGAGTAILDSPFPSAQRATGSASSGPSPNVGLNFVANCVTSCQATSQAAAAAQQAASLGTVSILTTTVQATNIGLRLNALRNGQLGSSVSGLALSVDGHPLPVGALSALLPNLGAGASADSSSFLSRLGVFANGQGNFGNADATSNQAGLDFHAAGLTVGADYRLLDPLILGVAFGYVRTNTALDSSAGDAQIRAYSGSLYGNYYILPRLYIDGIATFGGNHYDTSRSTPDGTATAKTDGSNLSISSSMGYNFNRGPLTFGPTGRFTYTRVHIGDYREQGAGPSNASVDSQTIESFTTDLGGQLSYAISMPWGVLTPLTKFEWEHQFLGGSRIVNATLLVDPSATAFAQTDNPDRNYFNLGAGVSATFKHGVSAFFYFEETLGQSGFTNHTFTGGVRVEF